MKSKSIIMLVAMLLFLPFVTAATTTINVKTLPYHRVFVSVIEPQEDYQLIKMFDQTANFKGLVSVAYDDSSKTKIGIMVVVKKGDATVFKERFSDSSTGGVIDLELLPADYVDPFADEETTTEEINNTPENTTSTTPENTTTIPNNNGTQNTTTLNNSGITGNVSSDIEPKNKNLVKYVIITIIVLAVIGFAVFVFMTRGKQTALQMPKKMSFVKTPPKENKNFFSGEKSQNPNKAEELEKKLVSLDKAIEDLKEGDKIRSIERRIEERQKLLEKMRRERGFQ